MVMWVTPCLLVHMGGDGTHMNTLCGIEKCITMVYHPHSNGLTQRINHSINEKKSKAVAHNQHKWLDLVAVLVWC